MRDKFTWWRLHICDRLRESRFSCSISPLITLNIHMTWNPTENNSFATICKLCIIFSKSSPKSFRKSAMCIATPNIKECTLSLCVLTVLCAMLQNHYRMLWHITERYRSIAEPLQNVVECYKHYGVLLDATERYKSVVDCYRMLRERHGGVTLCYVMEPLWKILILPIWHRMHSCTACASCTMPTADESHYSANGMLHSHHSSPLTHQSLTLTFSLNLTPIPLTALAFYRLAVTVLGKNIWGGWPLIIWEATTAKRNYYRTN